MCPAAAAPCYILASSARGLQFLQGLAGIGACPRSCSGLPSGCEGRLTVVRTYMSLRANGLSVSGHLHTFFGEPSTQIL